MYTKQMRSIQSTGANLANQIRDAINAGRWAPGFALRQEVLAEEFNVSRIPVRDALALLQSEGLVVIQPNRGAYVSTISAGDVAEIFDLRVLLETNVLGLAVPLHTRKSIGQMESIQRQLNVEDNKMEWIARDRAFHDALYAPSGRKRSLEMIRGLRGPIERFSLIKLSPGSRRAAWSKEHHSIIAAVTEGSVERSINALTEHLRNTQKAVIALVSPQVV